VEALGHLPASDPLQALLAGALSLGPDADFEVFALSNPDGAVFLYVHRDSGRKAVAKFYGRKWLDDSRSGSPELRGELLRREFANLEQARTLGFSGGTYFVPRPLAMSDAVDWMLLEEHVGGINLHHAIWDCVVNGNREFLFRAVGHAAGFLRQLHGAALPGALPPARGPYEYHAKVLGQLRYIGLLDDGDYERHLAIGLRGWDEIGPSVPIHGDATPEHFLWSDEEQRLGVIDFESFRAGVAAEDLGYLAAEMKHLFWYYSGDRWASEPFIARMYEAYGADYFQTERAKFFMAVAELRIARNFWLPYDYRRQLIEEAERCSSS